ncbi:hypothetical protein [Pedobacter sp. N23S346]|uniref:hypothetical protein n=1 Tax=Pedobacter sp. N23S346 TaxID=3402750 RepID=UPI003ABE9DB9
MEELMNQIKAFLGNSAKNIFKKGPAEIEVVVNKGENAQQISEHLKEHIITMISEDAIAKISFVDQSGNVIDSFSLNQ